jgi:diguanylate cyclase (GGDEF)-like protein
MDCRNLLVVDDSETFCLMVEATLRGADYRVVSETDARNAMKLLREGDFDAVLLDLMMPEMSGLELLDRIRKHFSVLPVVVVSGHGSGDNTLEAMRRGATDFVSKPIDGPLLDLRIRRSIDLEQARRLANTDGLTGLYNHRYLQERLQQEIKRAERYRRQLSLVMADLDHFKLYNDAYGHPRGDQVLIEVAETLRHIGRSCDVVARYGGEEFTLILPETPAGEALVLAERARECIEALAIGVDDVKVTISLGIASFHPGCTKEELVENADMALYRAKHEGRNRVCVASSPGAVERVSPFAEAFAI